MIVADTTLIAHLLIPGLSSPETRQVFSEDSEWYTVPLWKYEFLNTLLKYFRAGYIVQGDIATLIEKALELMSGRERQPSLQWALQCAIEYNISAYDAHFVALARDLDVPLVTLHKKLVRAAAGVAFAPADYLAS